MNTDLLDLARINAAYRRCLEHEKMTGGDLLPAAERLDTPENLLTALFGLADRAG